MNRDLIAANAGLAGEVASAYSAPMSLYDYVRDLPLVVDGYTLEGLELRRLRPDFTPQDDA